MEEDRSDRMPDAAEVAAINATHFADTALRAAYLLFVFGTREDADLRAEKACQLWREGFAAGPLSAAASRPNARSSTGAMVRAACRLKKSLKSIAH